MTDRGSFVKAIIIVFSVGLIYSIASGFKYTYMTNDDYMVSLMLANGDNKCIFVNFFLTAVLVELQKVFSWINWFSLSQLILCLIAITIVNYVLLSKTGMVTGIIFSIVFSSVFYGTSVIMIQYTQTTTVVCVSAILLHFYSFLYETRKKYRILQRVVAYLLILVGSLYRIQSFHLICISSALLLLCILIEKISEDYAESNQLKPNIRAVFRKNLVMITSFALAIIMTFGVHVTSEWIKNQDENYVKHAELGLGRQYVTDYYVSPYDENRAFYNSIGIVSPEDLELTVSGYIDKDYIDAEKMIAIGEYSLKDQLGNHSKASYALLQFFDSAKHATKRVYSFILKLKNHLAVPIGNKLFVSIFLLLVLIIIVLLSIIYYKKQKRLSSGSHLKILLIFIWISFFVIYPVNEKNVLLLPTCAVILLILFKGEKRQVLYCYIFSLYLIGIYCYQICFRLNFRASFTFVIPALAFLTFLYVHQAYYNSEKRVGETSLRRTVMSVGLLTAALASALYMESMVWTELFIPQIPSYDNAVVSYIDSNSDKQFMHVISANSVLDKGYYNIFAVPRLFPNSVLYGSWCISSDYYDDLLVDKGIDELFAQVINNDSYRLFLQLDDRIDVVHDYEKYLNNHYAQAGYQIKLIEDKLIDCSAQCWENKTSLEKIGIYSLVLK